MKVIAVRLPQASQVPYSDRIYATQPKLTGNLNRQVLIQIITKRVGCQVSLV